MLEYGIDVARGKNFLLIELPAVIEAPNTEFSDITRCEVFELYEELKTLDLKVQDYDKKIEKLSNENEDCRRIKKIKGIGPIVSTAIIAAVPDPKAFKNGREFSAWIGLVPRQHSSGGKENLLGISKRGDPYLRKQLIHGCRSTVYRSHEEGDSIQKWVCSLKKRRGNNKATVALANKNARLIWAALTKKEDFKFVA